MRLLVRIWLHGLLLFVSVAVVIFVARYVLPRQESDLALRSNPYLALSVADRALDRRDDAVALARELRDIDRDTSLEITIFGGDDRPIASTDRATAPLDAGERAALAPDPGHLELRRGRVVVGAFDGDRLVAYAVATVPPAPPFWLHASGLLLTAIVLTLLFVAAPLTWSIARPLAELSRLARRLGDGDLTVRAPDARRDELGELARSFNDMAARIERLRAAERRLLADVSHELRTPLARVRVLLDLADDADPAQLRAYLREINTDLGELEQLTDDIITSSRLDADGALPLRRRAAPIGELLDASAERFARRWPERRLERDGDAAATLDVDPGMLRRALDNLLDNAAKYSDAPVRLAASRAGESLRIEVADQGIGIAPEDHARVFTPFFRADASRTRATGGVGLGLALARRIVEAHGGTLDFASEPGRGSRFWIELPVADQRSSTSSSATVG